MHKRKDWISRYMYMWLHIFVGGNVLNYWQHHPHDPPPPHPPKKIFSNFTMSFVFLWLQIILNFLNWTVLYCFPKVTIYCQLLLLSIILLSFVFLKQVQSKQFRRQCGPINKRNCIIGVYYFHLHVAWHFCLLQIKLYQSQRWERSSLAMQ